MPTYVYACRECGHRFDAVQSMVDAPLEACTDCGGSVRRVIGAVGVSFKGSGFYRTDSRGTEPSTPSKATEPTPSPAVAKPPAT